MNYCKITGETHCRCGKKMGKITALEVDIKATMRKLFTDHAVFTKFVLNSIVDGASDTSALLPRLMANQEDIGNQLKPIIGVASGNQVTALLKEHIKLAGDVITAATKNEQRALQINLELLFSNSERVGLALSSLNPAKLHADMMIEMFNIHNQFVVDMTLARLDRDYTREIELYDAYYNEILEMSDHIVAGLM